MKAGDKVWVLCEVAMVYSHESLYMDIRHDGAVFEAKRSDCRPVEPANCPKIPDSSSEPMRAAFEADLIRVMGWNQSYFGRNEDRYFDSSVEMAWQAFRAGARYGDPRGCPETTDREPQCEKDLWWGPVSDPINPSHYKHLPAEAIDIIEAAIAKAPSNQSAFLQGQVIKYLLRCWSKKGIEDLRKAKWYLDRLVSGFDDLLAEASGANDGQKEVGE